MRKLKSNLLVLLIILLGIGCIMTDNRREKIPSLDILLLDSITIMNLKDIQEHNPFALVYFSPDCDDCQKETELLIKNMDTLKHYKFYFITNDSFERLRVFNKYYKLKNYPNIILAKDFEGKFSSLFKTEGTPYTAIYDHKSRLRTVFTGTADISVLIHTLSNLNKN